MENDIMEKFHYKTLEELQTRIKELNLDIPFAKDTKVISSSINIGNKIRKSRR